MTTAADTTREPGEHRQLTASGDALAVAAAIEPVWAASARRAIGWRRWCRSLHSLPGLRAAAMLEIDRGTPFLFVPVFLAAGTLTFYRWPAEPPASILIGLNALFLGGFALCRSQLRLRLLFAALVTAAAGAGLAKLETWRAGTPMLAEEISTQLTARVAGLERLQDGRVRMTLDVLKTERPTLRYGPARVKLSARKAPSDLAIGAEIVGAARLLPPRAALRPGGYDFAFESYFDRIGANGFFLQEPRVVAGPAPTTWADALRAWVETARATTAERIRTQIGGLEGEVATALIVGMRAGIPDHVNENLRRTGLAHILSISGLHMALVAATVTLLLRAGLALLPAFASRHPAKKYAALAALAAIAAYLLLSGAAVAARRSFLMLAVMLLALLCDRSALTMRNLAIAATVILAISPHEVVGPSFQMSFAATAALIGIYAAWSEARASRQLAERRRGAVSRLAIGIFSFLAGLAATSVIAGIATTLYGVYHFQRVAPLSLFANLAAMPIVSIVVMPAGLIATALIPLDLDALPYRVMGKGLHAVLDVAERLAARSPLDTVGAIPSGAVVLFSIALVLLTLTTTRLRLAAVPFAVAGALWIALAEAPDGFILDDGRTVAMSVPGGTMVFNRKRPNAFATEIWMRAAAAETVIPPDRADGKDIVPPFSGGEAGRFACGGPLCVARHRSGALVVTAETGEAAQPFCERASLIVVADPQPVLTCPDGSTTVVTGRDLARWGSAEFRFQEKDGRLLASLRFAVSEPYRPWHAQRQFSRAARGKRLRPEKASSPSISENNDDRTIRAE